MKVKRTTPDADLKRKLGVERLLGASYTTVSQEDGKLRNRRLTLPKTNVIQVNLSLYIGLYKLDDFLVTPHVPLSVDLDYCYSEYIRNDFLFEQVLCLVR